nr:retrovirus-related Pol polyprotein from transposon TNT 1-94 [Tanacetum cinerariifolium]
MYRIDNRTAHTRAPQLPQTVRNTNPYVSTSIGVNHKPTVSRPQLKSNQSRDKVLPNNGQVKVKKTQVEVYPKISSVSNKMKSITECKDSLNSITLNANVVCATCNKCLVDSNHFACVTKMLNDVHARTKKPTVVPISARKPKSQANKSVATPHKKKVASKFTNQKPLSYFRVLYENTSNLKLLCNFVEKFLGTVRFGNDQFATILSYGDLVQGNVMINRAYYVEGLNHDLFSVGQFCDADLEVAFRKSTCFVRDLEGNDLLTGICGSDLYIISLQEPTSSTPLCLMAKASPAQAWLWHRRLSHLNFDYINLLSKKEIVIGLPKLKYVKDQLCSSCELSKVKRSSFKSKAVPSLKGRLNLLHIDLCGPMRVASINGKKYILVIVDDYSRYMWTLFLRFKDKTPDVLKDFLTMIQRILQALVITVRIDRGTEFLNKTLNAFYKEEGIEHQTSTARTPEQNGVVKRRNRTLALNYDNPDPIPQRQDVSSSADADVPSQQELNLLFGPLYDEFFNADHPLEQVHGNPSRPVQTRRQLATDPKMCMYALTVNTAEPKNIKEAMVDSTWIEAMQEELHQFDRLQVWELVNKPFGKMVIKLKWLWKNKKDEDQTVIRNKVRLVAKGYAQEEGSSFELIDFLDANHAGCIDSCKSTSGGIQFLGDKLFSWMSKKQNYTVISSAEAEYVALSASCVQVITEYQLVDMFTKALPEDMFKYLVRRIGMRCLNPVELEVLAKESA